jgi:hypothetical protein
VTNRERLISCANKNSAGLISGTRFIVSTV